MSIYQYCKFHMITNLPPSYFKQPMAKSFYGILLKLEDKVTSKNITTEEVAKLTDMYSQLVSYYDALMDPIKFYFMEKIQIVLLFIQQGKTNKLENSSRRTSRLDQSRKNSRKKEVRTKSLSKSLTSSSDEDEQQDQVNNLPEKEETMEVMLQKTSISNIKKSRQKKMSLLLQVNKAQEESTSQYNELLGNYDAKTIQYDKNIKEQLKEQSNNLQKRKEDRKKNRQKKNESLPSDQIEENEQT